MPILRRVEAPQNKQAQEAALSEERARNQERKKERAAMASLRALQDDPRNLPGHSLATVEHFGCDDKGAPDYITQEKSLLSRRRPMSHDAERHNFIAATLPTRRLGVHRKHVREGRLRLARRLGCHNLELRTKWREVSKEQRQSCLGHLSRAQRNALRLEGRIAQGAKG